MFLMSISTRPRDNGKYATGRPTYMTRPAKYHDPRVMGADTAQPVPADISCDPLATLTSPNAALVSQDPRHA